MCIIFDLYKKGLNITQIRQKLKKEHPTILEELNHKRIKVSEVVAQGLVTLYKQGFNAKEIANMTGHYPHNIYTVMSVSGIPIKDVNVPGSRARSDPRTSQNKEQERLIIQGWYDGLSLRQLCDRYLTSRTNVVYVLVKRGVYIPDKSKHGLDLEYIKIRRTIYKELLSGVSAEELAKKYHYSLVNIFKMTHLEDCLVKCSDLLYCDRSKHGNPVNVDKL